ncbi:hypothetical protein [Microbulbifer sp. SSSA005]|uniref:hypothetical protein n=1 Tax=Microbulbifer sp. SSSA005 TaxID=3243378 RepID=UPI004039A7C5
MRVIGLLCLGLLAGCANQLDISHWNGASRDDVILRYGAPVAEVTLSDGRTMMEFDGFTTGAWKCSTRFIVKNGVVVASEAVGNYGQCLKMHRD